MQVYEHIDGIILVNDEEEDGIIFTIFRYASRTVNIAGSMSQDWRNWHCSDCTHHVRPYPAV